MKTTIGPMLCKLNTAQASIPELAERKAAAEAEKRRAAEAAKAAAEREAAARRQREEAQRRKQETEAAARAEAARQQARKKAEAQKKKPRRNWFFLWCHLEDLLKNVGLFLVGVAIFLWVTGLWKPIANQIPSLWKPATCTEPEINKLTRNTRGEALGHRNDPICEICGETHDEAKDHFWDSSNCTDEGVCSVCGETVEARGHVMVTDHDGEYAYCRDCGTLESFYLSYGGSVYMNGWKADYVEEKNSIPPLSSMTLNLSLYDFEGKEVWTVYIRSTDGAWLAVGEFTKSENYTDLYTIQVVAPVAFNAVCIVPTEAPDAAFWQRINIEPYVTSTIDLQSAQRYG